MDGLGDFVELEVVLSEGEKVEDGEAEARRVMEMLAIDASQLVRGTYLDLSRAAPAPPSSR